MAIANLQDLEEKFKRLSLESSIYDMERKMRGRRQQSHFDAIESQTVRRPRTEALESEVPEYVDPQAWASSESGYMPNSRRDGLGNLNPVIRSESDLRLLQAVSRDLWLRNPYLVGLKESLQNFAIASGFIINVTTKEGAEQKLIDRAQKFLNRLFENWTWHGDLDREAFWRTIEDGEVNLRLHPHVDDPFSEIRVVEPEYLTQPLDQTALEQWVAQSYDMEFPLGAPDRGPLYDWSYGIQSPRGDVQTSLGYFVLWNPGEDWDYVPADEFIRQKRNTYRTVKPGLPDAYSIGPTGSKCMRLLRSMLSGAKKQAQMALITNYEAEATARGAQIGDMLQQTSARMANNRRTTGDWQADSQDEAFNYHAPEGRVVSAGPLATANAQNYEMILQAGLRCIGSRWSAPEYLISGDSSNSNFASTSVAESPFVKNMLACQYKHGRLINEIAFKALRHAWNEGYFKGFGAASRDWNVFREVISIDSDAPQIETRDKLAETQRLSIQYHDGVINQETYSAETGHNLAEEKLKSGIMMTPMAGGAGGQPAGGGTIAGLIPQFDANGNPVPPSTDPTNPDAVDPNTMNPDGTPKIDPATGEPIVPVAGVAAQENAAPVGGGNVADTVSLNGAQITAAAQVVKEVNAGTLSQRAGEQLLLSLGLTKEAVFEMFAEKPAVVVDPNANQQPVGGGQRAVADAVPNGADQPPVDSKKKQVSESASYITSAFAAFDAMIEDQ